ncbi:hypothetical protein OKC48_24010 [Methylorubrum extorquens]|uniref:hypothetical protein n=1 Tax=Methylorubrum extorquens TaxID=408 RepID=UPI002238BB86|nr:hypothetical protein [Methylorubrum extorquens]UYW26295.1 hypothetical protein OKC48_24010 [Methylorubrum extorquens]
MLQGLLRIGENGAPALQQSSIATRGLFLQQTADVLAQLRAQFESLAQAYETKRVSLQVNDETALSSEDLKGFLQLIDQLVEKTEQLSRNMSMAAC